MPYDSLLAFQSVTTNTVGGTSTFNATAVDFGTTPQGHEVHDARVSFPGNQIATAAVTGTYYIGESSDNTTFYQCSRPQFVTFGIGTVSNVQPLFLPFVRSQRYVRSTVVLSNATSGLVSIYKIEDGVARP